MKLVSYILLSSAMGMPIFSSLPVVGPIVGPLVDTVGGVVAKVPIIGDLLAPFLGILGGGKKNAADNIAAGNASGNNKKAGGSNPILSLLGPILGLLGGSTK
jgi:hypothetical protein